MTTIQKVSIPKPCHQSWQQMTPDNHGRHCESCAKTVVDFTRMTDAEVINYLSVNAGTCGRFGQLQLTGVNRQLSNQNLKTHTGWKKWMMAALLLGSAMFDKANGQTTGTPPKIEQVPANRDPGNFPLGKIAVAAVQRQITGQVFDDDVNQPLPGAIVRVLGTNITAESNVAGKFKVSVPLSAKQLMISFIGFKSKTITIDSASDTVYVAKLKYNSVMLGELAIVQKPPLLKRVYYRFIRKPFRKIFKYFLSN